MAAAVRDADTASIDGLQWLAVEGFKSHFESSRVEFPGLTVLCGANSSGKSSVMQPLLLLKQTFDSLPYDYGPLRLDGPNVLFNHVEQMRSRRPGKVAHRMTFALGYTLAPTAGAGAVEGQSRLTFEPDGPGVRLVSVRYTRDKVHWSLAADVPVSPSPKAFSSTLVPRNMLGASQVPTRVGPLLTQQGILPVEEPPLLRRALGSLVHLSGLRGQPERRYPRTQGTPAEMHTQGMFHVQAPSWVAHWSAHEDVRMRHLQQALGHLGLTWKIQATTLDATSIEIKVGRSPRARRGGAHDLVNIADVGFGVSQALPVVVALVGAQRGQMIYVEQPEIHLHPRAHAAMADLIADAVLRGCRVVIETHSDTLLRRVQTLVALGRLPAEKVVAHWFARDADGATKLSTVVPGADGSLGDWPEDFSEVDEHLDRAYADAAFARLKGTSA